MINNQKIPINRFKIYNLFKKVICSLLIISILATTVFVTQKSVKAASDDEEAAYTLSSISSMMSNVYNLGMMPFDDEDDDDNGTGVPGVAVLNSAGVQSAGCVVGMGKTISSLGQWVASIISGSSVSYNYSSLQKIPTTNGHKTSTVFYYAVYGHLLKDLGFDQAVTTTSGMASTLPRIISGGIMMIFYTFSNLIYQLFKGMMWILEQLNPFRLFEAVVYNSSTHTFDAKNTNSVTGFGGNTITYIISKLYATCANLTWSLAIPLMIAFFFFGFFVFKKTAGSRKLLIRILFAAVGLPVIGGLYTGFLNDIDDLFSSSASGADQIVLSTYVDFEQWAKEYHLKPFENTTLSVNVNSKAVGATAKSGAATVEDIAYLRDTCFTINKKCSTANDKSVDTTSKKKDSSYREYNSAQAKLTKSEGKLTSDSDNVYNVLTRYMGGDKITSETFASLVQNQISTSNYGGIKTDDYSKFLKAAANRNSYAITHNNSFTDFFKKLGDWANDRDTLGDLEDDISFKDNDPEVKSDEDDLNKNTVEQLCNYNYRYKGHKTIFNDGGLGVELSGDVYDDNTGKLLDGVIDYKYKGTKNDPKLGLSTLAMYNYLKTDFTDTEVVVYSGSSGIASGLTSKQHYSVNLIGTGISAILYYADACVLLLCIALIGLFYSVGMIKHALRNAFRVILATPRALLGSLRGIAKLVGIVITMICNVLVTAILYSIATQVLLGVASTVETVISGNILLKSTLTVMQYTGMSHFIRLLINIVFVVVTIFLIKIRKQTISQIDEWCQQVVSKFFEADSHQSPDKPKGQSLGSRVADGMLAGAGMAAGQTMSGVAQSKLAGALSGGSNKDTKSGDEAGNENGESSGGNGQGNGIEKERDLQGSSGPEMIGMRETSTDEQNNEGANTDTHEQNDQVQSEHGDTEKQQDDLHSVKGDGTDVEHMTAQQAKEQREKADAQKELHGKEQQGADIQGTSDNNHKELQSDDNKSNKVESDKQLTGDESDRPNVIPLGAKSLENIDEQVQNEIMDGSQSTDSQSIATDDDITNQLTEHGPDENLTSQVDEDIATTIAPEGDNNTTAITPNDDNSDSVQNGIKAEDPDNPNKSLKSPSEVSKVAETTTNSQTDPSGMVSVVKDVKEGAETLENPDASKEEKLKAAGKLAIEGGAAVVAGPEGAAKASQAMNAVETIKNKGNGSTQTAPLQKHGANHGEYTPISLQQSGNSHGNGVSNQQQKKSLERPNNTSVTIPTHNISSQGGNSHGNGVVNTQANTVIPANNIVASKTLGGSKTSTNSNIGKITQHQALGAGVVAATAAVHAIDNVTDKMAENIMPRDDEENSSEQ